MPHIHCNNIELYYEQMGIGDPVLFLHSGFSRGILAFASQILDFQNKYTCYFPDFRGHGRTRSKSLEWSTPLHAEDIIAFMDILKLPKVHLIGYGMGGGVALYCALNQPQSIISITSIGQSGFVASMESVQFEPEWLLEHERYDFINMMKSRHMEAHRGDWQQFLRQKVTDWRTYPQLSNDQLSSIKCPTLNGIYCMRSMKKATGYKKKIGWTDDKVNEGLTYVQLKLGKKTMGFIEYAPGEASCRVVNADGYIVIHCLWIGEIGKGYGSQLIQLCIDDAKIQNKKGVAVLTNSDTAWSSSEKIFIKQGFECVEEGPYSFNLYVKKFDNSDNPYFPNNWNERLERFSEGLTILRTDQCPYLEVATNNILDAAKAINICPEIIYMNDRPKVMELSPTPYGVFSVIYNGKLISYHRLTTHSFLKKLKSVKTF